MKPLFLRLDVYSHIVPERVVERLRELVPDGVLYGAQVRNTVATSLYLEVPPEVISPVFSGKVRYDAEADGWKTEEPMLTPPSLDGLIIRVVLDAPGPVIPRR